MSTSRTHSFTTRATSFAVAALLTAGAFAQTTWAPASVPPEGRTGHAMAYDAQRDRLVLFGGNGSSWYGDTWERDDTTWSRASTTGASVRLWSAMCYDSRRGRVLLHGGYAGSSVKEGPAGSQGEIAGCIQIF